MSRSTWQTEAELVGKLSATQIRQLERYRYKLGWDDCTLSYLIERLHDEVAEFQSNPSWEEAADVANFVAMIADRFNTPEENGHVGLGGERMDYGPQIYFDPPEET